MNFVKISSAPYGACSAIESEDDEISVCAYCRLGVDQLEGDPCSSAVQADTCRNTARAFKRRHLHSLYREFLTDYHQTSSLWMRNMTRETLLNIWENYRAP